MRYNCDSDNKRAYHTQTPSFPRRRGSPKVWLALLLISFTFESYAGTTIKDFLSQQFNEIPKPQRLWIDKEKQNEIKTQINPNKIKLSYRYWQYNDKVVWILDEIGKERDITTGIVIENNSIQNVEVLIYRESRGGQVQNQRFTQQYFQKNAQSNLSKEIDSISGATLSVNALNKQVNLALLLNSYVFDTEADTAIKEK